MHVHEEYNIDTALRYLHSQRIFFAAYGTEAAVRIDLPEGSVFASQLLRVCIQHMCIRRTVSPYIRLFGLESEKRNPALDMAILPDEL